MQVDWDVESWCQLQDTINGYIHIDLPPFSHKGHKYITRLKEHWVVRSQGRNYRYYGSYNTLEEAKRVSLMYGGRIYHRKEKFRVRKQINNKRRSYGYYDTYEEAERRVKELENNGWLE